MDAVWRTFRRTAAVEIDYSTRTSPKCASGGLPMGWPYNNLADNRHNMDNILIANVLQVVFNTKSVSEGK